MDDRTTYIGGSDVAAILGLSPYSSPLDVWRGKRGLVPPLVQTERMRWGHLLESAILAEYAVTTDAQRVTETPDGVSYGGTLRHPEHGWAAANVDGVYLVDGTRTVVDAKNTVRYLAGDDPCPIEWQLQVLHYQWITGVRAGAIAALVSGCELRVLPVPWDDWYVETVVPRLADFWRCVQSNELPPVPVAVDVVPLPDLGDEGAGLAVEYIALGAAGKAADDRREQVRARLLTLAGDARVSTAGACRVTRSVSVATRLDVTGMRGAHPDLCAEWMRTGDPTVSLRVTELKK